MRSQLVTAVLLVVSCVAAVFLEDAFRTDWVRHNYKSLSRSWLVEPDSILALAEPNQLVHLDADTKAITFLVNLAELGYTETPDLEVALLETYIVAYLEQKAQLLVFGKNSGVLVYTIRLDAAPKQVVPLSNNGLVVLDAHSTLSAWHSGELGVLASSCTSFAVFGHNGVENVIVDGKILQLTLTGDELEVNTLDAAQLGGHVILDSHILLDSDHGVSFTDSEVSINSQTEDGVETVWNENFGFVYSVQVQTTETTTYIVVVTPSTVFAYDVGKFLTNHKQKTITTTKIAYSGVFTGVLFAKSTISVLSVDENSFHVIKQSLGTTKATLLSVPKTQTYVTGKAILVDHPISLSVIDKVHHMVENSQTGSDVVRWLRRSKSHLAQFGKAAVGTVSGSPPTALVHLVKSLEGNIFGWVLSRVIHTTDTATDFENDNYGFEKVLVFYDSINKAVLAKTTKDGSFIWTQSVGAKDTLVDLISFNSEVYVVFTHSIHVLLLRTGDHIFEKKSSATIDAAIVLESQIGEKEGEEDVQPVTIALRSGDSFELLHPESNITSDQFVVSEIDEFTVQGYKLLEGRLIKTWKFSNQGEEIISISDMRGSLTSAVGITRGDRSVLYKYLNPNLLTVVTKAGTTLKVTLIDGATGSILHIQRHSEEIVDFKSINVVQADNWVIYSYFVKFPTVEQRITVLDLFTTAENAIGGLKSSAEGEYDVSIAQVSSKTFIYPEKILQLAATQTKFGITLRSILALTEAGQLVEIPKFFLNSRRIDDRKMTASDFEDEFKMMPYEAVIMLNNYQVLNHKIKLETVDNGHQFILVQPTDLESTAVVCFVNDKTEFCTTVQPSLSYDRLTRSFDKLKLLITIGVLFVVYFFTKPLVESKKLNLKWLD